MGSPCSSICSQVKAFGSINFKSMPTDRPIKASKVIRIDRNWYAVTERGVVYTDQLRSGYAYIGLSIGTATQFAKAMLALGVVTEADAKAFIQEAVDRYAASRRNLAAESILRNAGDAGLKLTKAQEAKLREEVRRHGRR